MQALDQSNPKEALSKVLKRRNTLSEFSATQIQYFNRSDVYVNSLQGIVEFFGELFTSALVNDNNSFISCWHRFTTDSY